LINSKANNPIVKQSFDEKLFGLLVASVKDYAIFMIDPNGYILSWNKGAEHIKGYTEAEIIGKHISVFYTSDDNRKNEPEKNLTAALKNGEHESEGWRLRKDGGMFWADVIFTPIYNDGQHIGFAKVTRDITERKSQEDKKKAINISLEKRVKENTEQIIANELKFRGLIENSYDGICLFDKEMNIFYRSKSAERINGWTNAEMVQYRITDLPHPDDKNILANRLEQTLNKPGVPIFATFRTKHKNGHYIWIECVFTNMLGDENINAIVSNFRDITQRRLADELLSRSNKELFAYKYALDEAAIVALTDQRGTIKHVNHNFCKISQYNESELVGQDHRIVNSSYHDKAFIANLWKTIAKGQVWKGEMKNKAKDGTFYWVDTTIVPFLNEHGKPYQYIAIRSDITDRKNSELEIRSKTAQIESILESITDGFVAFDSNLCYTYANKKIGEMLGYDPKTLIGKYVWDLFPDAVGSETYKAFNKALAGQQYICHEDYYEPLDLWQENHIYPSANGLSVFISDISDRKKAELEIMLLNESLERKVIERTHQLEVANKDLESFSYSVSHDLRTPLRAVNGYAIMLKEDFGGKLGADGDRLLDTIINNARLMGQLIDDLLTFSRLGRKEVASTVIDMGAMAEACVRELLIRETKTYQITINALPTCEGDSAMLRQVWMNLIGNAIKYSSKKNAPEIEIGCIDKNELTYYIKDNGDGFDMQYANKLFGVFQRLHRMDEFEGTGVGLALVKRIVDKHDGKIWAEAKSGEGATFYFTLNNLTKTDDHEQSRS